MLSRSIVLYQQVVMSASPCKVQQQQLNPGWPFPAGWAGRKNLFMTFRGFYVCRGLSCGLLYSLFIDVSYWDCITFVMYMWVLSIGGKKPTQENLERKPVLSASLPTTNPKWTGLSLNWGLCGRRLATNCLRHHMAILWSSEIWNCEVV